MSKLLSKSFYIREDVLQVSKDLLGKILVSHVNHELTKGIIVETEAYRAPDDKASHAFQNKLTPRTKTMFNEGGCAYVYICYGIHQLFNVVTGPEGIAHVVLIRAVQPMEGMKLMCDRRSGMNPTKASICNGPGKFTKAMGISKAHDGTSLMSRSSEIWIEDAPDIHAGAIIAGSRVGMKTAEESSNLPWRFRIAGNRWTSKPDQVYYKNWPL